MNKSEIEENLRNERFQRILDTLRNIEHEQALLIPSHENRAGRSGQNFFNNKRHEPKDKNQLAQYVYTTELNEFNKALNIKPISKQQIQKGPIILAGAGRNHHIDNQEMLYKILKGETKLVRSILEANNFTATESHEWNLLWATSSCKSYLYEGLNEYQRVNHFP